MERLVEKYGFNDEQLEDIKMVFLESLHDILPTIMNEIMPTLVQNFVQKTKTESEEIEEINQKRKSTLKYVQDNMQE